MGRGFVHSFTSPEYPHDTSGLRNFSLPLRLYMVKRILFGRKTYTAARHMTTSTPDAPQPPPTAPVEAFLAKGDAKRTYVRAMFDGIARHYDLVNLVISGGQTTFWRWLTLRNITFQAGQQVLDVGCGTGLMLRRLRARRPDVTFQGIDLSPEMIAVAREEDPGGSYRTGDVTKLEDAANTYDWVTTFYTLRNFPDLDAALAELLRVLKPGGRLVALDAFPSEGPKAWRWVHRFWLRTILPLVGSLWGQRDAYTYLGESILRQMSVEAFCKQAEAAGGIIEGVDGYSFKTAFAITIRKPENA